MVTGIVTALGLVLSILFWWLKNRAKSSYQIDKEQIEYERKKRQRDIDSWWLHRK